MSKDEINSLNQSAQTSQYMRQQKISGGVVNNELLKNIELLDSENTQLKAALAELQEDLKDKENSIEESHKIITKLKDEYSKLIKEYQNIEQINNDLMTENNLNKKAIENINKTNDSNLKLQKQNENLITEINLLKKENTSMKTKILSNNNNTTKKEQDIKDKELLISDLKEKADNWITMIKDREQLINEQSKKIKELTEIISRKDEQLKLMVNFSKEINKENKSNVAELTKQAVKTIKVFYNTLNNNTRENIDSAYRVEFIQNNTTFEDFETQMRNNKISFLLEDALSGMMYIPADLKSISKEFLMDMNLKTELIKSELFAALLREKNFVHFLEEIFAKLNVKDAENIKYICNKVITLEGNYNNLLQENQKLKKNHLDLMKYCKNLQLYIQKLKENIGGNLKKLKEKYVNLISNIDSKVKAVKDTNIILKEKSKKDGDKLRNEILNLRSENKKLKYEKEELKKLLDNQEQNEKIILSLDQPQNSQRENKGRNKIWNNSNQRETVNNFNFTSNEFKNNNILGNNTLFNNNNLNNNKNNTINGNNKVINPNNINNNYNKKKKEINNLKEQIDRVKDEINNIMLNSDNPNFNIGDNFMSTIKDDNYNTNYNSNFNTNPNINIPSSQYQTYQDQDYLMKKVEDLQTLLTSEKTKNTTLENEIVSLKQICNNMKETLINNEKEKNSKNVFTPNLFIKLFFNINSKIFSSSELKKYYKIYNTANISMVIEIFGKTCECLKQQIYESHFDIETANTDIDDNMINSRNVAIDSSYRLVNERILKLKKLEFDFINLSEFIKNYLVSQEIVVKMMFNANNNIIQFDAIEKLFKLFEDCLNFKIDEMNDSIIFQRKLIIKLLKSQKNCLGLSLESMQ